MERINRILGDRRYRMYLQRNAESEQDRKFCIHDFKHLSSVARITYILVLEEARPEWWAVELGADRETAKELIYAAGLLHDIGRWQEYATGEDHAEIGAAWARDLLLNNGFAEWEAEIVTRAIREHRSLQEEMTFLGERLYRADNLSRDCIQCRAQEECYKWGGTESSSELIY